MGKSVQKCDYCGFSTKNVYILKRHKIRCRKDHKTGKVQKSSQSLDGKPNKANRDPLPGPIADPEDVNESVPEYSQETDCVTGENADQDDDAKSLKPKPAVIRNYLCNKCDFKTNKSRQYLYHMIEEHQEKYDIFACTVCEYCSRYRHKVQRHMKFAHKMDVEYEEVQTEYIFAEKTVKPAEPQPVQVKPKMKRKKPIMSKSMQGKKLKVNFKKTKGADKGQSLKEPAKKVKGQVPVKPASFSGLPTGNVSRVVEETVGENGEPVFKCKECQFISDDKQKVAKHAASWHVDIKSFTCSHCDFISFERADFIAHRYYHRTEHLFKCAECTYSTDYKINYEKHRQSHTANLPHKCTYCTYSSSFENAIKRHITINHDVPKPGKKKPVKAKKSSSPTKVPLQDDPDALQPSTSDASLQTLAPDTSLDDSLDETPTSFSTNQSSLLFNLNFDASSASMVPRRTLPPPNPEVMQLLMNDLSQARKLPPNISKFVLNDTGKLVCPACKLKYKRSSDLNRHMKRKHGCKLREFLESDQAPPSVTEEMDLDDSVSSTHPADMEQDGDYIEEEIDDADLDDNLMDTSAKLDDDSPLASTENLQCKYCNFKAKWPSDLRRHMSVHSLEKRFKCNYCNKKYKYIGDMNAHIRKEHNKEPGEVKVVKVATIPRKKTSPALFKCPCCNYTSLWKSEIDRHSRIHTDSKTYQCKNCTYQTYWRGDIRRHVYKHHPEIMTEGVTVDMVIITSKKPPEKPQLVKQSQGVEQTPNTSNTESILDSVNKKSPQQKLIEISQIQPTQPFSNVQEPYKPPDLPVILSQKPAQINLETTPPPKPGSPKMLHMIDLGGGMFKCEFCDFTANAPSKLTSHIATHTNIKRYMCPLCGKRANWKWDISKHIRKDHNDQVTQVVKLSRQDAESTIQQYMDTNPVVRRDHHLNTPERTLSTEACIKFYKCSLCEYTDEQQISVARHMQYQHAGGDGKILLVKSSPNKYPSPSPDRSPSVEKMVLPATPSPNSNQTTVKHMKADNSGSAVANKHFMCSECGKKGATKGDIKKHYHYVHANKEIRIIYLSDGSQSVFASKMDLAHSKTSESMDQSQAHTQPTNVSNQYVMNPSSNTTSGQKVLSTVEPKTLGYIRPFKCSLCGRRSNWRWDILKHIRERHPGQVGEIITLTEEEARATVHNYVQQEVPVLNKMGTNRYIRKGKSLISDIAAEYSSQNDEQSNGSALTDVSALDGDWIEHTDMQDMPSTAPNRPFQCSDCIYRSTWRADVQRHIARKHPESTATVYMLKKEFAAKTVGVYLNRIGWGQNEGTKVEPDVRSHDNTVNQMPVKRVSSILRKLWKCSMCSYKGDDKVDVLKHLLGKHNMKAYRCTFCNWTANFRSGVYRHIQTKHNGDKTASCRLGIKFIKEGPGYDEEGELIVYDDAGMPLPSQRPPDNTASQELTIPESNESTAMTKNKTRNIVYNCRICTVFRSKWRSCVCRHLLQAHDNKEYTYNCVKKIIKVPLSQVDEPIKTPSSPNKGGSSPGQSKQPKPKNFHCNICPYRSTKAKMLRFHMRCHTPQQGVKQFKCKYCPYYVNRHRLLTQHLSIHLKGYMSQKETQSSPQKGGSRSDSPVGPKRHKCEKCPYTTNCKNDFMYHKQFHRPKPTADYKCDYCEYWVTHRRLLKQHMKVHSDIPGSMEKFNDMTPTKPEIPENTLVYDTVEIAEIKQRIIASKITPSISQSPIVSPMKIASTCSIGGKRGFLRKDGTYRKIHRCRSCPYMNIRLRNMRLHELMHGKRSATHPLINCPHCDYHVGSKGLLAHHLKVHQPNYDIEMLGLDKDRRDSVTSEDSEIDTTLPLENKVDTLLEIARYKKYGCEKCPYASAKKTRFQKHVELHGSKQKCKCDFCDYSVPSANLLQQHMKLHLEPNQNLLAAQSIHNLQHLPEMPADVALASMMTNSDPKNPVSITHDHIDLFENAPEDAEPKKLYRCDRCPYANVRRDNLLAHLRCHMTKNEYMCPYCDYSVGKNHVLVQHVKVHFSPLPELSEWLSENGDPQRMKEVKEKNITEALEIMKMFQNEKHKGDGRGSEQTKFNDITRLSDKQINGVKDAVHINCVNGDDRKHDGVSGDVHKASIEQNGHIEAETSMEVDNDSIPGKSKTESSNKMDEPKDEVQDKESESNKMLYDSSGSSGADGGENKESNVNKENIVLADSYVCQYCERDFSSSDLLVRHEMQHLIGNSYELLEAARVLETQDKSDEAETSRSNDTKVISDTTSDKGVVGDSNATGVYIVNQKGEKVGEMTPMKNRKEKNIEEKGIRLIDKNIVNKMEEN